MVPAVMFSVVRLIIANSSVLLIETYSWVSLRLTSVEVSSSSVLTLQLKFKDKIRVKYC